MMNPGYLVEKKDGSKQGRTFHKDKPVGEKMMIYLATQYQEVQEGIKIAVAFNDKPVISDPLNWKIIGFID